MAPVPPSPCDPHAYRPVFERRFLAPRFWPLWLFLGLLRGLILLPLPLGHAVGRALGRLYYRINDKRRGIARVNLALCFPQQSEAERDALVREHFEASGAAIIDYAMCWWASRRRLARLTRMHGVERLRAALDGEHPVILLTGHLLSVDVTPMLLAPFGRGVTMMKPLKNPLLNWLISRGRMRGGHLLFERSQGLRPLVRQLRHGTPCYFIPDEDFGAGAAVFAPFFGVPSWTVTSLTLLARLGHAVVVPVFTRSLRGGRGYEVYIDEPLADFPAGGPVTDATTMNRALEHGVRRMPEMYAWTFKLFKTRPDGEAAPY